MASQSLINAVNSYDNFMMRDSWMRDSQVKECLQSYISAVQIAFETEEDVKYGFEISRKIKKGLLDYIQFLTQGGDFAWLEEYMQTNKTFYNEIDWYYEILKYEAKHKFDSYCLYIERNRKRKDRFYEPRRKTLKRVADKLQMLEDDELDELFVHQPPRTGKTGIMTDFGAWHCARDMEKSNLYATYKESLGGAFLMGVQEIWTDPTYAHSDVFNDTVIVATDAKNHKIDLGRKKKYVTLSGKGLESGLNGEYDGATYEYNYDADGSYAENNFVELEGTSVWTDLDDSDPMKDIEDAQDAVEALTGVRPNNLLVSKNTMNLLKKNEKIKSYILAQNMTATVIVTDARVKEVFSSELGVNLIVYTKQYKNYSNQATKFYPDGFATLFPDGPLGSTWYGTTPEERTGIQNPAADVALVNTGVAVSVTISEDPVQTKTTVSEIVLPSFERMDETYMIKAYTPS